MGARSPKLSWARHMKIKAQPPQSAAFTLPSFIADFKERVVFQSCADPMGTQTITFCNLPYFFSYKTEFFSFQNNPKDLDPSYKMDLDLWDRLGRVKLVL